MNPNEVHGSTSHITRLRLAAGWTLSDDGWLAHDGTSELDWISQGFPCPEDPDYGDWFRHAFHWDTRGRQEPIPYPCAATE